MPPAQRCKLRGERSEIFIEDDCPKGAKILRPKGTERCAQLAVKVEAAAKSPSAADSVKPVQVQESAPASVGDVASGGHMKNVLFVLAAIGLLQGLITQAGVWPFVFVAAIMPLIVTWGMLSGADIASGEYFVSFGVEFLWNFLFCVAGWLAGIALRYGFFRFL
ncbi:MAG TPA: hypothetical protein VMV48_03720 [Gallionellaceae bacterium]|nr:hypothetical protein [Gallionellaceae bacterium]